MYRLFVSTEQLISMIFPPRAPCVYMFAPPPLPTQRRVQLDPPPDEPWRTPSEPRQPEGPEVFSSWLQPSTPPTTPATGCWSGRQQPQPKTARARTTPATPTRTALLASRGGARPLPRRAWFARIASRTPPPPARSPGPGFAATSGMRQQRALAWQTGECGLGESRRVWDRGGCLVLGLLV